MSTIYILWLRGLKHYFRSRAHIVASLGQPLLYLLVLGFGLGPVFQKAGQGNYLQFMAPGVIAMTVLFASISSGLNLIWDRQFGFLKEMLVAPVPRSHLMIGRALSGASVAMLQGVLVLAVCMMAGFRPTHLVGLPQGLLWMSLIAIVFSSLGTAIGSRLESLQALQMVMSFLVMPLFFLSGALYPLSGLPASLHYITSVNPLSYGVDGLRSALIGISHFAPLADFTVLAVFAVVFVTFGAWSFSRIEL